MAGQGHRAFSGVIEMSVFIDVCAAWHLSKPVSFLLYVNSTSIKKWKQQRKMKRKKKVAESKKNY